VQKEFSSRMHRNIHCVLQKYTNFLWRGTAIPMLLQFPNAEETYSASILAHSALDPNTGSTPDAVVACQSTQNMQLDN